MSKASDALHDAVIFIPDAYRSGPGYKSKHGPGQYVARMSPERRELLSQLKSDDIRAVPAYLIQGSDRYYFEQRLSEEKLKFDREVLGIVR
jgi:hypothetical protein